MFFKTLLNNKNISKYQLSKISGVPNSTINDIYSGKTSIENCSAKTIYKLSKALDCTMEQIYNLENLNDYNKETGLPNDKSYFECGLPEWLQTSIENMKKSWEIEDSGKRDMYWDVYWCDLNADINSAEVDQLISSEQAWYLREKFLRMTREII